LENTGERLFIKTKKNEKPVTFLKLKRLTFKLPLIIYK